MSDSASESKCEKQKEMELDPFQKVNVENCKNSTHTQGGTANGTSRNFIKTSNLLASEFREFLLKKFVDKIYSEYT